MGKKKRKQKNRSPVTFPPPAVTTTRRGKKRAYAGAGGEVGRLVYPVHTSSADAELHSSLRKLRDRSRAMMRDHVTGKRAKRVSVNNVIGKGIGQQAQVKRARDSRLMKNINAGIDRAWRTWSAADSCHTGGVLHFHDLERMAYGQVFEAGEVFIRIHREPFGGSRVPLALEIIEAERVADDWVISSPRGATVDLGIERDAYGRPAFYFFYRNHPNEYRAAVNRVDEIIEVPAADIIHLYDVERWPQSRGVPRLHAALIRLDQSDQFDNAALTAAVIGASKVGFYEPTEELDNEERLTSEDEGTEADGTPFHTVKPGQFTALPYGYKFASFDPTYPHEVYEPFTRATDRKVAAGSDVPYEDLTQDYSQSNYSSSRMSQIAARDVWRTEQAWWIRSFRERLASEWMQAAVFAGAIPDIALPQYIANPARFHDFRYKPRGWQHVDPSKDIGAHKEAERAGYTTKTDIIAETTGGTLEDYIETRVRELEMLEAAGLSSDTATAATPQEAEIPPANAAGENEADNDQADDERGYVVPIAPPKPTRRQRRG